jgi:hypothetical protein
MASATKAAAGSPAISVAHGSSNRPQKMGQKKK